MNERAIFISESTSADTRLINRSLTQEVKHWRVNIQKRGKTGGTRFWWVYQKSNSLAHVSDVVRGKEEVLKPLVAHFKHACGMRVA